MAHVSVPHLFRVPTKDAKTITTRVRVTRRKKTPPQPSDLRRYSERKGLHAKRSCAELAIPAGLGRLQLGGRWKGSKSLNFSS